MENINFNKLIFNNVDSWKEVEVRLWETIIYIYIYTILERIYYIKRINKIEVLC